MAKNIPDVDIDIYDPQALLEPYDNYRIFRDKAPIVRLPKYDLYLMSRFEDVKNALANWKVFSSAKGVAMNDTMNAAIAGGTLGSDDPIHARLRSIVGRPLAPSHLNELRGMIVERANALVERLCAQRDFDATKDLAEFLPLTVVRELVGLPEEGASKQLIWAAANFNSLGPRGVELTETALPIVEEMVTYAKACTPEMMKPGSWMAQLFAAADHDEIAYEQVGALMNDYLGPSLDTTIFATTGAISLFAQHPDQWDKLRRNPKLVPNAINEVVRLESPIQGFSRTLTEDFTVEDQTLHAGARVLVMYASGNRDERRWDDPEAFDIERKNADHLGFGHGVHSCLGANLARLEINALLTALLPRVERWEVHDSERVLNNILRGYTSLKVTAHPARETAQA